MFGTLCPCSTGKLAKPWLGELARSFFPLRPGHGCLKKYCPSPLPILWMLWSFEILLGHLWMLVFAPFAIHRLIGCPTALWVAIVQVERLSNTSFAQSDLPVSVQGRAGNSFVAGMPYRTPMGMFMRTLLQASCSDPCRQRRSVAVIGEPFLGGVLLLDSPMCVVHLVIYRFPSWL